jgi:hypothetical protein
MLWPCAANFNGSPSLIQLYKPPEEEEIVAAKRSAPELPGEVLAHWPPLLEVLLEEDVVEEVLVDVELLKRGSDAPKAVLAQIRPDPSDSNNR